jgi:hypothetical protein
MKPLELIEVVRDAFAADLASKPAITLRGGDRLDDCGECPPYEAVIDAVSDEYLESFHWGIGYLDAASWRHYLPHLADYVIRHFDQGTLVGEWTIASLSAPDREPPRLTTLTLLQEEAVVKFLEFMAFADGSSHQESACRAIDEWWSPNPLYRPKREIPVWNDRQ